MWKTKMKVMLLTLAGSAFMIAALPSVQAASPDAAGGDKAPAAAPASNDHGTGKAKGHTRAAKEQDGGVDGTAASDPAGPAEAEGDSQVSANSSAEAGVATKDGVEGEASADATAGVTETEEGTEISAETAATTAVSDGSEEGPDSRTVSVNKEITTKFGEKSMSMSMTFATLEDGTRVKTKSRARAMALETPGITKAEARSQADVRVQGEFGSEDAAVSEPDAATGDGMFDSPAISEANGAD
jgi:hypothetical protein